MNTPRLLAALRIWMGLIFLMPSYAKTFTANDATFQIETFVGKFAVTHAFPWYRGFLHDVVMTHVPLFAILVAIGEWYVCVALIAGFTTRLASGVAVFMLLNFWAAKGGPGLVPPDLTYAFLCVLLIFGAAGRTWGVDRFLHARFPKVPIW